MAVIRRERDGAREVITLSGDLTVSHAKAMRSVLHEAVHGSAEIVVALERITEVDITFPQLLCATHRTAAALRKNLVVKGEQEGPVARLLRTMGFQRQVGCRDMAGTACLWLCARGA